MAGVDAFVPIGSVTLTSAQPSVSFTSLPQGFRDLQLVVTPIGSGGNGLLAAVFNSDTGSNYVDIEVYGEGTAAGTSTATRGYVIFSVTSVGTTVNPTAVASIFDYSQTDKHKAVLVKYGNNNPSGVMLTAARWTNTAAITSVTVKFTGTDTFAIGSTFNLFGVRG